MTALPIGGERDLWRLWEERRLPPALRTRTGQSLRIVFPGRANTGAGPDFTGAQIAFADGSIRRGDVELHLRASSWRGHGHHRDPHYADVILHVVLLDDAEPARTLDDRIVQVLALGPLMQETSASQSPPPGAGPCMRPDAPRPDSAQVQVVLAQAGEERFAARAARWEAEFATRHPADCMLTALLRAAGLGRNGSACAALAESLDGPTLDAVLSAAAPDRRRTTATGILLGMAGLLEQARADKEVRAAWAAHAGYWPGRPLDAQQWQRFRLRPANLPEARLGAVALMPAEHGLGGFLALLTGAVEREPPLAVPALLAPLTAAGLGRGWALEAWTNVLLPLAAGYGAATAHQTLTARAAWWYAALPGGGENQVLTRMAAIAGLPAVPRTAMAQQGLLHIWSRYCEAQRCAECPLAVVEQPSESPP